MNALLQLWNGLGRSTQSVLVVVLMLLAFLLVRAVVLGWFERMAAATSNDMDDRMVQFARQFLWIFALFLTVIMVLRINEIEISPLLAGAGIVGVAVGFAAKETLADVLAGIFLIADRPMRVGDRLKIERIGSDWGGWGDVVDVGLRRTRIRNTDGVIVNYPNSLLANSVISNFSSEKAPVRVRVRFQVSYDADLERAIEVALEAIDSIDAVLPDSSSVLIRSLWNDQRGHLLSGVLMEGRYRIEDVRKRSRIRSRVLIAILQALHREGVPLAAQPVHLTGNSAVS